ncbi:MAG: efflux RND transporter permease subunit [Cytophagales bacterium]|nr:MAG: efflux RND transporter permease subunit [Cytophagales bacterium]TAF59377.1 MAG: efflux RND transporter permease subunit [Cytophagales bacterium]
MSNSQNKKEELATDFAISSFSIRNGTSVIIMTLIFCVMGVAAYIRMPKESFPEIVMPTVFVTTVYPGNSPVDIENLITRPLEKEIKPLKGVKKISSTSSQDVSSIVIEFEETVDIAEAVTDVKDAVDKAKTNLPTDLDQEPAVRELDFSEMPVMEVNLSGDFEVNKLKEYAEDLQDEIEMLPEVSKAELTGAIDREIQINCDPFKMEALKVSFGDVEGAIAAENMTISGGDVRTNGNRRSLRIDGEFASVEEIENIIVKAEDMQSIYLKDIAEVRDSYVERKSFARLATKNFLQEGSKPVICLQIKKRSGQNLIKASEEINSIIERAKKTYLPASLSITITNDQSEYIIQQVNNLENNIISGIILVVGVLVFFMGFRNSIFVGISIPLSMFISTMVLESMGITINMVVLFALILALGMLVDNAIVVVENVYRLLDEGYSPVEAAKRGVAEVAWSVIGSTATTVAAFVPLAFWGGIMGEFMKYLPITFMIVLTASLFIGLVINPVLAARYMKSPAQEKLSALTGRKKYLVGGGVCAAVAVPLYFLLPDDMTFANMLVTIALICFAKVTIIQKGGEWIQGVFLVKLDNAYRSVLYWALRGKNPYLLIISSVLMLFLSLGLVIVAAPKVVLFPENDPQFVHSYLEFPLGTDVQKTDSATKVIEKKVYQHLKPYQDIVRSIVVYVGEGTGNPDEGPSNSITPHKCRISIAFVDFQKRNGKSSAEVMKSLGEELKKIPGVKAVTEKNNNGPPVGKPISIELTGLEYNMLIKEADRMKLFIDKAQIPGVDNLKIEVQNGKPELLITINREQARKYGLSTSMVAMGLRTAIFGKEVSKFKEDEDDYPIQLRLDDKYRNDITLLMNQRLTFRDNKGKWHQVPLAAIAELDYSSSFGEVKRKDLDKMVVISSNIVEGYNPNEVVDQIKAQMTGYEMPKGYAFRFGGEQEEQAKSMAFLGNAMLIALSVIFLILVTQFNSALKPFIIMTSVVLSTIGVFLGLSIFRMDFVIIMTGIGIISLAGIVVNNGIVLIDYTTLVEERTKQDLGLSDNERLPLDEYIKVLVEGGYTRLRPVMLTASTNMLGLIPMATGFNFDFIGFYARFEPDIYVGGDNAAFWGPMAWTIIFGMSFATFLTLVITPVMQLLAYKAGRKLSGKKKVTTIIPPPTNSNNA